MKSAYSIDNAQKELASLLESYPQPNSIQHDLDIDAWQGQFSSWAKKIWKDQSKIVTDDHTLWVSKIVFQRLCPALWLEQTCHKSGWPEKASHKLRPTLIHFKNEMEDLCGSPNDQVSMTDTHTTELVMNHHVRCISALWSEAHTPSQKNTTLQACLSGAGRWVVAALVSQNPQALVPLSLWMEQAQYEPWWDACGDAFWKDFDCDIQGNNWFFGFLEKSSKAKWAQMYQDPFVQKFLHSMPTPTPLAKGFLVLLTQLSGLDCAQCDLVAIKFSPKWFNPTQVSRALGLNAQAMKEVEALFKKLKGASTASKIK